jgi:cation/acetate symporter
MCLNLIVMISISRMTAPPPAHIQRLVDEIRVPRQARESA